MSASIDLTAFAELESYLGDTGLDATLGAALIDSASEFIENFCQRKFKQEVITEYFDGSGFERVVLSRTPVATSPVVQLWDDSDRDYDSGDLVSADDYTVKADSGIITLDSGTFADGNQNVKVTYTGGYSATTAGLPDALRQAATIIAAAMYERGIAGADVLNSRSEGGDSTVFSKRDIPSMAAILLQSYKRRR